MNLKYKIDWKRISPSVVFSRLVYCAFCSLCQKWMSFHKRPRKRWLWQLLIQTTSKGRKNPLYINRKREEGKKKLFIEEKTPRSDTVNKQINKYDLFRLKLFAFNVTRKSEQLLGVGGKVWSFFFPRHYYYFFFNFLEVRQFRKVGLFCFDGVKKRNDVFAD